MNLASYLGIILIAVVVLACIVIIAVNFMIDRTIRCHKCGKIFKLTKQEAFMHFIDGAELYPFCPECDQPYDKQMKET